MCPRAGLIPAPPPPAQAPPPAATSPKANGGLGRPVTAFPSPPTPGRPITGAGLQDLVRRLKRLQNGSDIRGIALEGEKPKCHWYRIMIGQGVHNDRISVRLHGGSDIRGIALQGENSYSY